MTKCVEDLKNNTKKINIVVTKYQKLYLTFYFSDYGKCRISVDYWKQKAFTHTSSLLYEAHLCGHPNETLLREPPALALKGGNLARILGLAATASANLAEAATKQLRATAQCTGCGRLKPAENKFTQIVVV